MAAKKLILGLKTAFIWCTFSIQRVKDTANVPEADHHFPNPYKVRRASSSYLHGSPLPPVGKGPGKGWKVLLNYYDYQLIKARRSFSDEVLALKLGCYPGQLSSFPMVTSLSPEISRALLPTDVKGDKLPLETEPAARDNNTS